MTQGRPTPSYQPGHWTALATDSLCLLADLDAAGSLIVACWDAVEHGAGMDDLLGLISREPLPQAPSFALIARQDKGMRLLVAGRARAEILVPGHPYPSVVDAVAPPYWTEQYLDPSFDVHLVSDGDALPPGLPALPLIGGIVLATRVRVAFAFVEQLPAEQLPVEQPSAEQLPVEQPSAEQLPVEQPSAEQLPVEQPPVEQLSAEQPFVEPFVPDVPRPAAEPLDPSNVVSALPWRTPDAFESDALEGGTVHPTSPEDPALDDFGAAPPAPDAADAAAPAADDTAAAAVHQAVSPDAVVPDAVIVEAEILEAAIPEYDAGPPPLVPAIQCPSSHLNPPYLAICRVCGVPIPQQDSFSVERPTLGVLLVLATGETIPLDHDVLLGRAPFSVNRDGTHLVPLASPNNDISRSHVRVALDGWSVQVVDLASTNGTVVTLPGEQPVRLRPHDPFTIVPETTLMIADEVSLRFTVPS